MTAPIDIEAQLLRILETPPLDKIMEKIRETIQADVRAQLWEATLGLAEVTRKFPHHLIGQMTKVIGGGYLFFAEYGFFLATWSLFEVVVEVLIMRELNLRPRETSIVCGGLAFGAKLNMLLSLLARDGKNKEGIILLRDARRAAERNDFAHGFLHYDDIEKKKGELLVRQVKDEYFATSKPLDIEKFAKHITEFVVQVAKVMKHFNVDANVCVTYTRSISIDAQAHAERAQHRQTLRSNAKSAKKKQRLQTRKESQG